MYVALSFLRKRGLSRWLVKAGDGCLLAGDLRVAVGAPYATRDADVTRSSRRAYTLALGRG